MSQPSAVASMCNVKGRFSTSLQGNFEDLSPNAIKKRQKEDSEYGRMAASNRF